MQRVKDPDERKRLQKKSRRIFLRIAVMAVLLFISGIVATMVLLPKLTRSTDDETGPCLSLALAANASTVSCRGLLPTSLTCTDLCSGHGNCDSTDEHSHCVCMLSIYDGVRCESLSLGFLCGSPTAVLAILWLLNLARILFFENNTLPKPTLAEMENIYATDLLALRVRQRPSDADDAEQAADGGGAAAAAAETSELRQRSTSKAGKLRTVSLSSFWSSGEGAIVVLVRRPG